MIIIKKYPKGLPVFVRIFLIFCGTLLAVSAISSPLSAAVSNPRFDKVVSTHTTYLRISTWTDSEISLSTYVVALSSSGGGTPFNLTVSSYFTTVGITTASFSSLVPNLTYWFIVKSTAAGDSGYSAAVATVTFPVNPSSAAPTGVTTGQVTANWTNGANSTNTIYNILASSGTFGSITGETVYSATTSANATSYTFGGLPPNMPYNFIVRALWAGDGNVGSTATIYAALPSTQTLGAPTAPSGITVTAITATSITFGWKDESASEEGFIVLASSIGIGGTYGAVGAGVTSLQVAGVAPNSLFKSSGVVAYNSVGTSTGSVVISSYTLANVPGSPGFTSISKTSVWVAWGSNSNPATVVYEVSLSPDNFISNISTPSAAASLSVTSVSIGSLSPGSTYYFRVRAKNSDGVFSALTASTGTVAPLTELIQSSGAAIDAGATTLTVDAGVSVLSMVLADGTTQQVITATQAATAAYGNGISIQLYPGIATVVASLTSLQLTSTQTLPVTSLGTTVEATSGTASFQMAENFFMVNVPSSSPQDVQTTILGSNVRTIAFALNPPSGEIRILFPPGALSTSSRLRIKLPDSYPSTAMAMRSAPSLGGAFETLGAASTIRAIGIGIEIILNPDTVSSKDIPITITYRNSDIVGTDAKILAIARYDDTVQKWITLGSTVDSELKKVTATTRRFSKFQLVAQNPATDVDGTRVYPNPLRLHTGRATEMVFTNMNTNASLKIYTYAGELVREMTADDRGEARWDARNRLNENVASGIYVVLIEGALGSKKVLKVAVEK